MTKCAVLAKASQDRELQAAPRAQAGGKKRKLYSNNFGFQYAYDNRDRVIAENRVHAAHAARTFNYDDASRLRGEQQGTLPGALVSPVGATTAGDNEALGQGYAPAAVTLSQTTRSENWSAMDGVGNALAIQRRNAGVPENESRLFSTANEILQRSVESVTTDYLYDPNGNRAEESPPLPPPT